MSKIEWSENPTLNAVGKKTVPRFAGRVKLYRSGRLVLTLHQVCVMVENQRESQESRYEK